MPTFAEHLEGDDALPRPPAPSPDVIDAVKAAGVRRRTNRHRRNLAGAVLALGLLALPATARRARSDDRSQPQEVAVAAGGLPTMSDLGPGPPSMPVVDPVPEPVPPTTIGPVEAPATTLAPAVGPAPVAAPSRTGPTTTAPTPAAPAAPAAPATTTTTARVCRDSVDPACGDFRWDPPPSPNQPLVAEFTKKPTEAVVGQAVEFEVVWSDGDARLSFERFSTDGTALASSCSLAPRYGPWTPPAATGGSGTLPYRATFPAPGKYRVIVTLGTASCASPYGNDRLIETLITVT